MVRQDLTAIGVGIGPGPFTGLRVGLVTARTLGLVLEIPVYGVCSLDVLAVEAATAAVGGDFVVATDARRKEVYLAAYDASGARTSGPVVDKPAELATSLPAVGEGAMLYPDHFPTRLGPGAPLGRLARALHRRASGRADGARADLPAPARRPAAERSEEGLVIRAADHLDIAAVARLEAECLGADAWSPWLVEQGIRGELPTVQYVVAEVERQVVGYAVASIVAEIAELQRIAVDREPPPHRPRRADARGDHHACPRRAGRPAAARGAREQRGGARVLRRRRASSRSTAEPATTATAATAVVMRRDLQAGGSGRWTGE